MANQQQPSFSEQQRVLALWECKTNGEQLLDRSRKLPQVIERDIEGLIKELGHVWLLQEVERNPFYLP